MLDIKEQEEPERHYLPTTNFLFDWNKMLYGEEEESGIEIDWNKLIYNEEQMIEFDLKKNEKIMRPEHYEYLFKPPSQRSDMEKFFLQQSGFCNEEEEEDEMGEVPIRLITSRGDNGPPDPELVSKQNHRF
jgi:hypothetical protein